MNFRKTKVMSDNPVTKQDKMIGKETLKGIEEEIYQEQKFCTNPNS